MTTPERKTLIAMDIESCEQRSIFEAKSLFGQRTSTTTRDLFGPLSASLLDHPDRMDLSFDRRSAQETVRQPAADYVALGRLHETQRR